MSVPWHMRRPRQDGQNPRLPHENATSRGRWQPSHCKCAKRSVERTTSYVTLEVGANKLGQACTLEAMLHGRVEGAQVLAHETVQSLVFRLPAGVRRAGG